jgi:predicted DNA-binding protein
MVGAKDDWPARISAYIVDELVQAKIIKAEDFDRAVEITKVEINARLAIKDWPVLLG